jgi:hypothetical protein
MDLRDYIASETSSLAQRLISASEAATQQADRQSSEQIHRLELELASAREQLQAETSRANTLAARVDSQAAQAAALAAKADAETQRAATLTSQLDAATRQGIALAAELERTTERNNVLAADREAQTERASALAAQLDVETLRVRTLAAQVETEADRASALAAQLETETARSATLASDLQNETACVHKAEAALARVREEVHEAHALADAASEQMSALTRRIGKVVATVNGSAASMQALGAARTVPALFAALVRELAKEFERVAIFRMKSNHLEGDLAAGLDDSVDVQKIVIPMGLSSLITKAASSAGVEQATGEEIGDARPPFGGSPAFAMAAPLLFDNELLAVLYFESDTALTDARGPCAEILVRHANAVLAGLAQELRTCRQLRDYARTLLDEAAAIFDTDVRSGVPENVCLDRLRASIHFARDLYTQRAAFEGPLSLDLLDDEIGRMLREPSTPFISSLASILAEARATTAAVSA